MIFDERVAHKAPTQSHSTPPRRRAPRWLVPFVSAVVLLTVCAAGCAPLAPSTPQASGTSTVTPTASPLRLDPAAYGMACVADAAWSPDSTKIAIVGTRRGCGAFKPGYYYPTVVAIVNAKDGQFLKSLQPDTTALNAFHLHVSEDATPTNPDALGAPGDLAADGLLYRGLVWSPDSKRIAMPFLLDYFMAVPTAGGSSATLPISAIGLYVGAVEGTIGGLDADAFGVTLSQRLLYVAEWNVKTGKPVAPSAPDQGTVRQLEPASLSYIWRSDGSLAGSGALTSANPPAPAPLGPVGNPDGGTSFTVWQGMRIQVNTGDPRYPQSAAAFMAESNFMAWSPDGTYVLNASYAWRVQPSKQDNPSPTQLQSEGAAYLPLLPIRDAAMDAMLSPEPGGHPNAFASDTFTWSPNGKMLAAVADGGANPISAAVTVLIADCASGKTLATLHVGDASTAYGNLSSLQWSPDGKELLIGAKSEYFVFGPGKLPQE